MDGDFSANDFSAALPSLLPKAIAWAEEHSTLILKNGEPLTALETKIGGEAGVVHPELIRVYEVSELPFPNDVTLRQAALAIGLLGPNMVGLTLGYGIYLREGHRNSQLLAHELRHVYQYEREGSIASFLSTYLEQTISFGYTEAPMEIDARTYRSL